ncbi:AIR synthase-related protein [Thermococcus sp. JCM 11816]|uniref:AIR synthase-related protein n=1 Tax=Thermococcus sp. (strain JCM 11816 / KS-1) TaxID=1295125 RepID=UPI00373FD71C
MGRAFAGYLVWKYNLEVSESTRKVLYEKFLEPIARVKEGIILSKSANSAIDISDGLSKELHLTSKMSGVRIEISSGKLPIREEVYEVAEVIGKSPVELALASGEEFELLFTVPPEKISELDFDFTVIGQVREGKGVYIDGEPLFPLGWEHFSRLD